MAVKGIMDVHLIDARGLKSMDTFVERMDPYVILQYRGEERKSRVLTEGGSNPTWNEKFTFPAEYPVPDNQYKLVLKVMDEDTITGDDFAGAATIHVGNLISFGAEGESADLPPSRYRVVLGDLTYHGEIRVGVTFRRE